MLNCRVKELSYKPEVSEISVNTEEHSDKHYKTKKRTKKFGIESKTSTTLISTPSSFLQEESTLKLPLTKGEMIFKSTQLDKEAKPSIRSTTEENAARKQPPSPITPAPTQLEQKVQQSSTHTENHEQAEPEK